MLNKHYNEKVDIFSLGIILYEVRAPANCCSCFAYVITGCAYIRWHAGVISTCAASREQFTQHVDAKSQRSVAKQVIVAVLCIFAMPWLEQACSMVLCRFSRGACLAWSCCPATMRPSARCSPGRSVPCHPPCGSSAQFQASLCAASCGLGKIKPVGCSHSDRGQHMP